MPKLKPPEFNRMYLSSKPSEIIMLPKDAKIIEFDEGFLTTDQLDPQTVFAIEADNLKYEGQSNAARMASEQQRAFTLAALDEAQRKIDAAFGSYISINLTATVVDAEKAFAKIRDALIKFGRDLEQERADRVFPWAAAAVVLALAILTAILVVPNVK